jgi:putative oxidoreductase
MTRDLGLLILRLAGGGLALAHGWGKVISLSAGQGERLIAGVAELGFPAPGLFAWAAALAEFVGGLLVVIGLGTRVAAAFAAFTMIVAAFGRHKAHLHLLGLLGLQQNTPEMLRAWGNPELALVYLCAFLAIALIGPGRFALDAMIGRGRKP